MGTVPTALPTMGTAMADSTMATVTNMAASFGGTRVMAAWIEEKWQCLKKEKDSCADLRCDTEVEENLVWWQEAGSHHEGGASQD